MRAAANRAGYTALELVIVMTLILLLLLMGIPRMVVAYERSRVEMAEAGLMTLWTGQRVFRMQAGRFADDVGELADAGLVPEGLVSGGSNWYYDVSSAERDRFLMRAVRRPSGGWSGALVLREDGRMTGGTSHVLGDVVQP